MIALEKHYHYKKTVIINKLDIFIYFAVPYLQIHESMINVITRYHDKLVEARPLTPLSSYPLNCNILNTLEIQPYG